MGRGHKVSGAASNAGGSKQSLAKGGVGNTGKQMKGKSGTLNASQAAIAGSDAYGDDQNSEAIDSKNQREIANV